MEKFIGNVKDNPSLKQRELSDGQISLYLEYYLGRESVPLLDKYGEPVLYENGKMVGTPKFKIKHLRKKESLDLYLLKMPKTPIERQHNKEILQLAKQIRQEREKEFLEEKDGYKFKRERQINFLDYFQAYIDNYTKKDIRMVRIALQRFKDFLRDTPEFNRYSTIIKPEQLNKDMMRQFTDYLKSRSRGEGAKSLYQRFKKVVNYAVENDVILKNPCKDVVIRIDEQILRKDVLSMDEVQRLIEYKNPNQNNEIRRAFIFCLYCGLRFCDVKDLTFSNVDFANKILKFEQNKTKGHSCNSGVVIPLNDGLLRLVGKPADNQNKDSLIFNLPSYEMCLKSVRRWVKGAGIDKHITWHCARHSFAVNILNNGANVKTLSSLLGHSGLKHVEKYTRAIDTLKRDAIDSLQELNF